MRNSEAKRLSSLEIAIHVISSAHQPLRSSPQKSTSVRAAISDAAANNGLQTAARRSQCSVPDGMQVDHNHQLAGTFSGRTARKSAAIPVFRHHRAADLAGGAIGSQWRSGFRFARVGHEGRSEYRLRRTEDVHRARRYPIYPAHPDRLLGLDWQTPAGRARSHPSGFSSRQRRRCPRAHHSLDHGFGSRPTGTNINGKIVSVAAPAGRSRMRGHKDGCQQNTLPYSPDQRGRGAEGIVPGG